MVQARRQRRTRERLKLCGARGEEQLDALDGVHLLSTQECRLETFRAGYRVQGKGSCQPVHPGADWRPSEEAAGSMQGLWQRGGGKGLQFGPGCGPAASVLTSCSL